VEEKYFPEFPLSLAQKILNILQKRETMSNGVDKPLSEILDGYLGLSFYWNRE